MSLKRHALCEWPATRTVRSCDLFGGVVPVVIEYRDNSARTITVCRVHADAARALSDVPLWAD